VEVGRVRLRRSAAAQRCLSHLGPARRPGNDEPLEWAGLVVLDATDVGEQPGMLFDVEAERRRAVIRAAIERVDGPAADRDHLAASQAKARPRVPKKEPTNYHIAQVREILAKCNPRLPQEDLVVRLLVGSGLRVSEACGLSLVGPDGMSDLMLDSMQRNRVELRVRWDSGAKGKKSRRVPITPKLAAAIKQYEARYRPDVAHPHMLINERGMPFQRFGIDAIMDRLKMRTGLRDHAHAFRHTFATVATKLGWNME
jgi:integrase